MSNINLNSRKVAKILTFVLVIIASVYSKNNQTTTSVTTPVVPTATEASSTSTYIVSSVIDGDTVKVSSPDGAGLTVRLLAINTPEMNSADKREKCLAHLATRYAINKLLGKRVYLEQDVTQSGQDKYGRTLAYLTVVGDTEAYNYQIMKDGLARVYRSSPPAREYYRYQELEVGSSRAGIGLWSKTDCR